ncbi:MAG TPA: hypothetical protein VJU17_12765, partial [Gemmatimonadales bacterium]|nr:hypothetical protein [Gemmatimonadales bacterium]
MSRPPLFWLAVDGPSTFGMLRQEPDWIAAVARDRLSRLLFHVARNNTFYGRRLQSAGIEWADPVLQREPYRALAALPLVSKAELRRAGLRKLDGGRLNREWYSSSSSGSTGEPFRVYYEARAWARLKYLIKLRARAACGVRVTDRVALLDTTPAGQGSILPSWERWRRISVFQPTASLVTALQTFRPDVVYGLPSALQEAGRLLRGQGDTVRARAVFTSGELLQGGMRAEISAAFQAPVYDVYGTSETKEIAWECSAGNRHINSDVVHLEAVDDSGRIVPDGVEGDLVATVLVNRAMPLLRYRTGDRGSLRADRCSCGCPMPLLGLVTGRISDVLVMRDGLRISPYALTCAIEQIPGLLRYQVSQL